MAEKSKILVIGSTSTIGKYLVRASAKAGNPTFAFVRESALSNPEKSKLIEDFKNAGVKLVFGDIHDHKSLVSAIKQVDVVISTVASPQVPDQVKIIAAIKEAGNVKRFLPSEFGSDSARHHAIEPAASIYDAKVKIRRAIEAEGIPHTYVVSYGFAGLFVPTLGQWGATAPPRDKVVILGDGNPKAIFVKEEDVALYTVKAVDDPRTLNKTLYMRPPANIVSFGELVSLWEKKIGKTLEKTYILEDQFLKNIKESPEPLKIMWALLHSVFIRGDGTNYEIDASIDVEATKLYPEVKYTTVEEYLDQFV